MLYHTSPNAITENKKGRFGGFLFFSSNEKLDPFNLKLMKIYHPFTKLWEWFLVEKGGEFNVS